MLRFLPAVSIKGSRVDYAVSPAARAAAGAAAALAAAAGLWSPPGQAVSGGLWLAVAALLVLAALSEDRWSFDTAAGRARRRFGLLFPARSWSLGLEEVDSFVLRSGEGASGASGDAELLAASLQGLGRGPWLALCLRLSGGRTAVLAAGRRRGDGSRLAARFRADGQTLSGATGIPFVDLLS